ncbi:hypothetical protein KPL70_023994 [Citrus sinensis]|nr:hypothetical protein KPL70_023994 [Citrus sinensis]
MKLDYQRKVAMLNKQKKRGTNSEALEKIKAAVSHLHTRYIVDMQSMDSTVLEINRLRDEMALMWGTIPFLRSVPVWISNFFFLFHVFICRFDQCV